MENKVEEIQPRKVILIFGISSFVGSNLAEFLKKDYRVVGTYYKNRVDIDGVFCLRCDVLSKEEVQIAIYRIKPDYTIYCVGLSSILECAKSPDLADALNTVGVFYVTESCHRFKSQLCYISSNYVFSGGEDKFYSEIDPPDPSTLYGRKKVASEFFIQKNSLNYMIFRCSHLYGRSFLSEENNWFEKIQRNYNLSKQIIADNNVKVGFLDVLYLAMIIKISFEKKIKNRVLQISSQDSLTYYEFTQLYAKIFSENLDLCIKSKWVFPINENFKAKDSSEDIFNFNLDISSLESLLSIVAPTVEESLEFTKKRLKEKKSAYRKILLLS